MLVLSCFRCVVLVEMILALGVVFCWVDFVVAVEVSCRFTFALTLCIWFGV